MITAEIGFSQHLSTHTETAKAAAEEAKKKLKGQKAQIVFVFSSIEYNQVQVLKGVRSVFPDCIVVGGSAAGEIVSWATLFDAVNVMAIASDSVHFTVGRGTGVSQNSFEAAANAAKDLLNTTQGKLPHLAIALFDGITGNGSDLVEGVKSVLGENFPLIGGSMGDDYHFEKTYEYYNDEVLTDSVIIVGFSGEFSYGFGIKHGWEPVGLPLEVTKATGALLQEINHQPAIKLYEDYFGKDASELIKEPLAKMAYTYPLGTAVEGSDEYLIRDPVIANEKGEITMAAAIPEGSLVRLMIGDRERAIDAAKTAAKTAVEQLDGHTPRLILMFNCMARNKLLGVRCSEENETVQTVVGQYIPMLGLYTYGECGPLLGKKNTPAYFHNETMTLLVIGD